MALLITAAPNAQAWDYPGIPYPTYTNSTLEALGYTAWPYDPCTLSPTALPSPWTSNTTGFYFVETGGTNSGNGYPGDPAGSFPSAPPAGAVIVVGADGGDYTASVSLTWSNGTSSDPIFIVSEGATKPHFSNSSPFGITGDHIIVDNISVISASTSGCFGFSGDHVTARNCKFQNTATIAGSCIGAGSDHTMYYNCEITGPVTWIGDGDDRHGWKGSGTDQWFINCNFHDINGDGIQVGDQNSTIDAIRRIWIGGNSITHCSQTGVWMKRCRDVVVSSNDIFDCEFDGGSVEALTGAQYENSYLWWINNTLRDNVGGVHCQTGGQGHHYFIGNVFYGLTGGSASNPHTTSSFTHRGNVSNCHILFNTFDDCASGIQYPNASNDPIILYNAFPSTPTFRQLYMTDSSSGDGTLNFNYYRSTSRISWGGGTIQTLSAFQAATVHEDDGITNSDPLFTNPATANYLPQSGSALVDAGTTVPAAFATFSTTYGYSIEVDFLGNPRTSSYDIGAYERQ